MTADTVQVELGPRSYDIVIGAGTLSRLGDHLRATTGSDRVAVVTDETVHALHGASIASALSDFRTHVIVRPEGEAQKSMEGLDAVLDSLFRAGFDRSDTILAFGGGVIGDLTGFAASVFKRGATFVQVPTTLLAQVDSSVGGKTAINNAYGKNLVGAFHQPRLVLIDTDLLQTLPERQVKAGYAEIVKYGLIDRPEFFMALDDELGADVLALEPAALREAISVSCTAKAAVVAQDERESGTRALLNLGHTFAHALELQAGYDGGLLHGEAVSAGMDMAFEFSHRLGLCPAQEASRIHRHLSRLGMPTRADMGLFLSDPAALIDHMRQDKKNEGGRLTLILARGIGQSFIDRSVSEPDLLDYLKDIAAPMDIRS
ncbi:3-dehydroquinate synthase [uncultured Algimonas sp.]|uniref:3-dehydroquinate synthase n=1 Tax=uncultured Algimonas sp. TaxID=1547920 RepID=UPI00262F91D0|nr:3-dehydroquinate synthase [uncultured Algimonas sp.]